MGGLRDALRKAEDATHQEDSFTDSGLSEFIQHTDKVMKLLASFSEELSVWAECLACPSNFD